MAAPWRPADITDGIRGQCTHVSHPDLSRALVDQAEIDAARTLYRVPDDQVHITWQGDVEGRPQLVLWPMRLGERRPD